MTDVNAYRRFLAEKHVRFEPCGIDPDAYPLRWSQQLRPHQWQEIVIRRLLRLGRAALFADCGLGKTLMQLLRADVVTRHTGKRGLILAPLSVGPQTVNEAKRLGLPWVEYCPGPEYVSKHTQIVVTNYERLHKFRAADFGDVTLDESGILKAYTGKTKQALIEEFRETPYRLACTATPAPNDRMELGNHADFLGAMPSNEMIARWFINEGKSTGKYRLKSNAEEDFWQWVGSWAILVSMPSDVTGNAADDAGYELPPLDIQEHWVVPDEKPADALFTTGDVSATNLHKRKRESLSARAALTAKLVAAEPREQWIVWCGTDYEADALLAAIPDARDVRGKTKIADRERLLTDFADGRLRVLVTKPRIAGFGLNWQHCARMTWFAGFSFEQFYQAVRRCWRFGQERPVTCHVVMADGEESIRDAWRRKSDEHAAMKRELSRLARHDADDAPRRPVAAPSLKSLEVPAWLSPTL